MCFYAKIASETGDFDIADVCDKLTDKLIFRHPHVYGEAQADTAGQVSQNWEQIKLKEKDGNKSVLGGVPEALPSLIKAYRIQDKARNVGFDWEKKEDVWDKVREELGELQAELAREDKEKSTDEFGDFLFSVINAGRLYHINPDNALERTNRKFIRRFNYVEQHSNRQGGSLKALTWGARDVLWNDASVLEKRGRSYGPVCYNTCTTIRLYAVSAGVPRSVRERMTCRDFPDASSGICMRHFGESPFSMFTLPLYVLGSA